MKIYVKVKPNSSQQKIESFGNNRYLIYLKSPAENNLANIELIKMLSKYFGTPPDRIKIKYGLSSKEKILEVI